MDIKCKHVTEADHNETIDSITWKFIQNYAFKFESIFFVNMYNNDCKTEQKVIEILMKITHNKVVYKSFLKQTLDVGKN